MKISPFVILSFVFVISSCATNSSLHDCPTQGPFNKYSASSLTVFREDGKGTENIDITAAWCRKGSSGRVVGYGLSRADGTVLLSPLVDHPSKLLLISDKRAYVLTENENMKFEDHIWNFETKEKKETEWNEFFMSVNSPEIPGVRTLYAFRQVGKTKYAEIALFVANSKEPRVLKNLGGPGLIQHEGVRISAQDVFERVGDIFITRFTAEDGKTPVSQILNLSGDPLTPMIGVVKRVNNITSGTKAQELISEIGKLGDIPNFPKFTMSLPLDQKGQFIKLPQDVIGVSKLHPTVAESYGWIVFFQGKNGVEGGFYRGTLDSLSQNLSSIKRFASIGPVNSNPLVYTFWAKQLDGKWRVYDAFDGDYLNWPQKETLFGDYDAVYDAYKAFDDEEKRKSLANFKAEQERKRLAEEKSRADYKAQLAKEIASSRGTQFFCYKAREISIVGEPFLSEYLSKCTPQSMQDVIHLKNAGVSGSIVGEMQNKVMQKNAAEQARLEADRQAQYNADAARAQALKAWSSMGPLQGVAAPQQQSEQQKRYQMEKDVNKQIFNKAWDPYK